MDVIRVKEGRLDIGKSIIKKTMELILDGNSEHVAGKNIRFVIALDQMPKQIQYQRLRVPVQLVTSNISNIC